MNRCPHTCAQTYHRNVCAVHGREIETNPRHHEPKPYCCGCPEEFHPHDSRIFQDLGQIERVVRGGGIKALSDAFPVGSLWHYGPNYENMETIVRVVRDKHFQTVMLSGTNHSKQPEDADALDRPCYYVNVEVVSSLVGRYLKGHRTAMPPHTLIPRHAVIVERGPQEIKPFDDRLCSCADTQAQRIADLERALDEVKLQRNAARASAKEARLDRNRLRLKVKQAQDALR